jgi:hypothetical protein
VTQFAGWLRQSRHISDAFVSGVVFTADERELLTQQIADARKNLNRMTRALAEASEPEAPEQPGLW